MEYAVLFENSLPLNHIDYTFPTGLSMWNGIIYQLVNLSNHSTSRNALILFTRFYFYQTQPRFCILKQNTMCVLIK